MSETISTQELSIPSSVASVEEPLAWLREMAATLRGQLLTSGAILLHGLPLDGPDDLARARDALGIASHTPSEAFTNRGEFGNGIQSPISWPDDRVICPFQESSFSSAFPSAVLTACITPPDGAGRTHLSDTRRILDHLPEHLAERIRTGGWIMTRSFHDGFGSSWRKAFSVPDRASLDTLLEASGIEHEWLPDGTLHTVRRRPGVITHPSTGEECWFNDISFLNAGNLNPAERRILTEAFGEHLPIDTFFGDGSPLSDEDVAAIGHAYESVKVGVPWRHGDLLVVDNIMMAQGRSVFGGSPEFLVAFGDAVAVDSVHASPQRVTYA